MPQIPPITDAYIDEIIKAPDAYNPTLNKTQGVKLRELIKKLRDYFTQEIQQGSNEQNFTSGLTKTGDTIKLGGRLTGSTEIYRDGKDFLIFGDDDQFESGTFGVTEAVSFIQFDSSSFSVGENYARMASNESRIVATGDKITLSTPNNKGAYYDTDYSPLWTVADENVLVSKKYVDALGIPAGGETLQSITDRGSTTTTSINIADGISAKGGIASGINNIPLSLSGNYPMLSFTSESSGKHAGLLYNEIGLEFWLKGNSIADLTTTGFMPLRVSNYGNLEIFSGVQMYGDLTSFSAGALTLFNDNDSESFSLRFYHGSSQTSVLKFDKVTRELSYQKADEFNGQDYTLVRTFELNKAITSGTYTPTLIDLGPDNVPVTPYVAHYTRVGNEVTVTGRLLMPSGGGLIKVGIPVLPIASNLTALDDASGMATAFANDEDTQKQGDIYYDVAANSVVIQILSAYGTENTIRFSFTYTVK